jgi:hypothetical protein
MANALQAVLDRAKEKAPEKAPKLERAAAPPRPRPRQEPRARPEELAERPEREGASKSFRPVREGKRFVGAHFHPEVARQLKMLAAEDGTTIQELLEQAVDLLFVKSGKAKIGDLVRKG